MATKESVLETSFEVANLLCKARAKAEKWSNFPSWRPLLFGVRTGTALRSLRPGTKLPTGWKNFLPATDQTVFEWRAQKRFVHPIRFTLLSACYQRSMVSNALTDKGASASTDDSNQRVAL